MRSDLCSAAADVDAVNEFRPFAARDGVRCCHDRINVSTLEARRVNVGFVKIEFENKN
jgi:hypothetical protein